MSNLKTFFNLQLFKPPKEKFLTLKKATYFMFIVKTVSGTIFLFSLT